MSNEANDSKSGTILIQPEFDSSLELYRKDRTYEYRRLRDVDRVPLLANLFRLADKYKGMPSDGTALHERAPCIGATINQHELEEVLKIIGTRSLSRAAEGSKWTKWVVYNEHVYFIHIYQDTLDISRELFFKIEP